MLLVGALATLGLSYTTEALATPRISLLILCSKQRK